MKQIQSGEPVNDPGMRWQAKITLRGAGADGNRGVAQMKVGFIQNVTVTKLRATYTGIAQQRVHGMEAHGAQGDLNPYLDGVENTTSPWYDTGGVSTFFDPSPTKKVHTITSSDSPGVSVPVRARKDRPNENLLTRLEVVYDFALFVSAVTRDTRNDADDVYAKQAIAPWQWDGSQDIAAPDFDWDQNASVVNVPADWTEVTDGTEPRTAGPLANSVINDVQQWNKNWTV